MSTHLSATTIADAWIRIMSHLLNQPHGKCFHLITTISSPTIETTEITKIVDRLAAESKTMSTMENANAIWPHVLARPGQDFAQVTKRVREFAVPLIKKANDNHKDSYVERLVAWRSKDGGERIFQLENVVARMKSEVGNKAPKSSSYEIAIFSPGLDAGYMGFPCLSHLSFKLDAEQQKVHLTTLYRNHHFVTHGYGNFLGLGRLMKFVSDQVGYEPGELVSVSTHADAELHLGKARIEKSVNEAKRILEQMATDTVRATTSHNSQIAALKV